MQSLQSICVSKISYAFLTDSEKMTLIKQFYNELTSVNKIKIYRILTNLDYPFESEEHYEWAKRTIKETCPQCLQKNSYIFETLIEFDYDDSEEDAEVDRIIIACKTCTEFNALWINNLHCKSGCEFILEHTTINISCSIHFNELKKFVKTVYKLWDLD